MAQSRFTPFLQRVRLLIFGQQVKERRQQLSHQFSTDASPAGRIGHTFGVGTDTTTSIDHTVNIDGIVTSSGLQHELDVPSITVNSFLNQQFNINELSKEKALAHTFDIPFTAEAKLSHEFTGAIISYSNVNHEFNVPSINTTSRLNQQFNIEHIDSSSALRHSFGVEQSTTSQLAHTFSVQQTTTSELGQQFDISSISSSANLNHEVNIEHINRTIALNHSFGVIESAEATLSHSFGVSSAPQFSDLGHDFNIYGIIVDSKLHHDLNISEIIDKHSTLTNQFAIQLDDTKSIFHEFTLAYTVDSSLGQEVVIDSINKTSSLSHSFHMNAARASLGHSFSAIGVASVQSTLSHQFDTTYTLPSNIIQHQFNLVFSLPLPDPTIYSGELRFVYDESNELTNGVFSGVNYPTSPASSYSDPVVNPITSSGTWFGVDPNSVIPDVASGLNEADFFHGSFVFYNDILTYSSGFLITVPEHLSDTIFLRQAWTSPVITTGYGAWWGINDFPIGLSNITLTPGEQVFGAFFGRQTVISGLTSEKFELFDPVLQSLPNPSLDSEDPFVFSSYDLNGQVKFALEREFMISGIYVTKPNGFPGSLLKRGDTIARLGFTHFEQDYQPEQLSWSLGVNTPPNTFTQVQTTDQWVLNGLSRDFIITALQNGDTIRGRIRAYSPKENTSFTNTYPLGLLAMSSSDSVNLWGGGTLVWPNITDVESTLDIEYTISGVDRGRIPAMITLKYENVNAQPKVLRLFRKGSNNLEANLLKVPVDALHEDQFGTLKIITKFDQPVTVSGHLGVAALTVYKHEGKNAIPKVILTDEESD